MEKRVILFTLLLFGGLSISQCSLIDGGQETIDGPHYVFLVFNENEVQTKPLKLGPDFGEGWWQDQLYITLTNEKHLAIHPGASTILIASKDLKYISRYSLSYDDNQLGPWFRLIRNKDIVRWDDAVSDSVVTSITVQKFNTEDPNNPFYENIYELHAERPSQDRFLSKTISSHRINLTGYELYGYNVMQMMVKDSLGTRLSMNPYYHLLNAIEVPKFESNSANAVKIDNVPSLDIPFKYYAGTLNNRFSFVIGYSRELLVFDSKTGPWNTISTQLSPYFGFINTTTAITDSSLAFVNSKGLWTYNPLTKKLVKLHPFEESTQDAVVQYDEQKQKLLLIYHYRETEGHTFTGREFLKVFSFDNYGQKTEVFTKKFPDSPSAISNFIKVDGMYYVIIKKHS
ncbi:hypothetical protein [Gracilimonas mengyeensis]|uniref:Uncharacterized protein n=1 Tax=Gracilimonas mengyeensis TaxID=1302730 RepID=A0A521C0L6_9BACT|nr:hypothetical protein [Gracilimonas mengyeensis]SMO52905.1 hypothetical protein SAMN06265219_10444 [Gracilimonas mengyeensis]